MGCLSFRQLPCRASAEFRRSERTLVFEEVSKPYWHIDGRPHSALLDRLQRSPGTNSPDQRPAQTAVIRIINFL